MKQAGDAVMSYDMISQDAVTLYEQGQAGDPDMRGTAVSAADRTAYVHLFD